MFPPNDNGQTFEHDAAGGETLTGGVVITSSVSSKKNSLWFRYVVLSIVLFTSHDHQGDHDEEAPPPHAAAPEEHDQGTSSSSSEQSHHVIDIRSGGESEWKEFVRIVEEKDLFALRCGDCVWARLLAQGSHHFEENENGAGDGVQDSQTYSNTQRKGFLYSLLQACNSFTILLLFVTAGLLFAIEMIEQGAGTGWHDGAAVLFAIFILVVSSLVRNFLREREVMRKHRDILTVEVKRDGKSPCRMAVSDVKVKDIVTLCEGVQVPGDGLFIMGDNLTLDEVINSKIDRDKNPFLRAGSRVLKGCGSMIVTSIGTEKDLGDELSYDAHGEKTLLQVLVDKPYECIENFALCMSFLIAFVALIRVLCKKHDNYNGLPELKGHVTMKFLMQLFERAFLKPQGRVSILVSTLVAFVLGIQHGMPLVIVVCLNQWKEKLVLEKAHPQNLSVCGTIGRITVIIIDATGSGNLLCKEIEVQQFWVGDKDISKEPVSETDQLTVNLDELYQGINVWVNSADICISSNDDLLISWAKSRLGRTDEYWKKEFEILKYRRSISSKKSCGVLMRKNGDQALQQHWKGPASTILDMCTHFYDSNGERHSMENHHKEEFGKRVKDMENDGLRPIAFACGQIEVEELRKEGLNLLAIGGLKYPCREEIKSLVETLRNDKISVKLVSEDELPIVRAIACDLGILTPGSDSVGIEGKKIREMAKSKITEMEELIIQSTIIGDSLPKDKLLMVEHSQKKGQVVAFYGGLTTRDIQALVKADVGITHVQENKCTEMARRFSDIYIGDWSLAYNLVKKSRCVYHNIQKFFQLQLTAWVSGFIITLVSTMYPGDSPLTSLDMIWVNLIMCILGGLMMVMELTIDPGQFTNYKLGKRTDSLITKFMRKNIAIQVCYQVSLLLIFQFVGSVALPGMDKDVLKAVVFSTFTFCQLFNMFNAMNLGKKEVLKVVLSSHYFLVALTTVVFTQVMLVQFGKGFLSGGKLNVRQWIFCLFCAALSVAFEWLVKQLLQLLSSGCSSPSSSANSDSSFSIGRPCSFVTSYMTFPLSLFLLFSASLYFHPDIAHTFR